MSTLGNFGAVAGGIMGGMKMREDMNARQEERDMRRQEFGARMEDREAARQAKEKSTGFYSNLGTQPFMQTKTADGQDHVDFTIPVQQDAETLNKFKVQAYQLQGQDRANALTALNDKKAELLAGYIQKYAGDPNSDPYKFAQTSGRIGAHFGDVPTGAQAIQFSELMKKHQREGAQQALKLANAGDTAGALKAWNENGEHRFANLRLVPAQSSLKTPSFKMIGITADGKEVELAEGMTAFDAIISLESGIETAKLAMQRADKDTDNKRADDKQAHDMRIDNAKLEIERGKLGLLRAGAKGSGGKGANDKLTNDEMKSRFGIKKPGIKSEQVPVYDKEGMETGETKRVDSFSGTVDRTDTQSMNAFAKYANGEVTEASYAQWLNSGAPGATERFKKKIGASGSSRQQVNAKPFNPNDFMRK